MESTIIAMGKAGKIDTPDSIFAILEMCGPVLQSKSYVKAVQYFVSRDFSFKM